MCDMPDESNGLTVLKLGGAVLTKKESPRPKINGRLSGVCAEVAAAWKDSNLAGRLILVHGAGSFGHPLARRALKSRSKEERLYLVAQIQRLLNELNARVCAELQARGVPALPFQLSSAVMVKEKRLFGFPSAGIKFAVGQGILPVLYGVPVLDNERGFSILGGDEIAVRLGLDLGATRVICATSVDGVYSNDQKNNGSSGPIKKLDHANIKNIQTDSEPRFFGADVTGSMAGKLRWLGLAAKFGILCEVISGVKQGVVERALRGKTGLGTTIGSEHLRGREVTASRATSLFSDQAIQQAQIPARIPPSRQRPTA